MGKADNAVQITKELRDITNQYISINTVHRRLRNAGLRPVVKRKRPFLKPHHQKADCNLLKAIESGLWRTGRELFGQMRLKSIAWGQMEGNGYGKR